VAVIFYRRRKAPDKALAAFPCPGRQVPGRLAADFRFADHAHPLAPEAWSPVAAPRSAQPE